MVELNANYNPLHILTLRVAFLGEVSSLCEAEPIGESVLSFTASECFSLGILNFIMFPPPFSSRTPPPISRSSDLSKLLSNWLPPPLASPAAASAPVAEEVEAAVVLA